MKNCIGKGRKHCGKMRKCWLPAFSPFPMMFSKCLSLSLKSGMCGKGSKTFTSCL